MDRNLIDARLRHAQQLSLSARRAWIEIAYLGDMPLDELSLSARRAWIEIGRSSNAGVSVTVALRKESVDRNHAVQIVIIVMYGRSPQGERG